MSRLAPGTVRAGPNVVLTDGGCMGQPGQTATATRQSVEQVNLRVPVEIKEYLEKLATSQGTKLHPYVLKLLEDHVAAERASLAEIYRRDADLAAKTAAALDRQAAAAERKIERAVAERSPTIDDDQPSGG
jgi:hypothetical protein